MLKAFGPFLYTADGPTVSFFGFPYPTRMAVVRLSDGSIWVWSPVKLTQDLADEAAAIDQAIFRGSFAMEEVVFFHRESRTTIFGDLIQRFPEANMSGWKGMAMRLGGLVGERGSAPREWRASFFHRSLARAARKKVIEWNAERLLIAHGDCVHSGASEIITAALSWI